MAAAAVVPAMEVDAGVASGAAEEEVQRLELPGSVVFGDLSELLAQPTPAPGGPSSSSSRAVVVSPGDMRCDPGEMNLIEGIAAGGVSGASRFAGLDTVTLRKIAKSLDLTSAGSRRDLIRRLSSSHPA